jgi:hypothetical protein
MNPIFFLAGLLNDGTLLLRVAPVILGTLLICLVLLRKRFRSGQ